jgi:3-oxoacyl-(acyl-carrier-protein) synthase
LTVAPALGKLRGALSRRSGRTAVITGRGVICALGADVRAFWKSLVAGRTGIAPIGRFPAADLAPRMAAEVQVPAIDDADRAGSFALHAAREALDDAALVPDAATGVALGTTLAGMGLFERWTGDPMPGLDRVPYFAPAVRVARTFGCGGPVATPQLACASGTHAVALAAEWIRTGEADVVLAGGTDLLCRFVVAGFNALRATAEEAKPFDVARRGLVLGEGAAVLVVEAEGHARRRGAFVRARIAGTGAAADATHMTAPDREGRGAARAMSAALADAGLDPGAVDFVSAHGTGTVFNDAMEAMAIARVFGPRAVPVDSIKGAVGHALGAAGALEAVVCLEAMRTGFLPPTAGLTSVDPACDALDLVLGDARRHATRVAVSTSSGFAGANAAIVLVAP